MMNLFDVSAGLARNTLLKDRPHRDGSPIARSLSDMSVMVDPFNRDQVENKNTMSESRRNSPSKQSNITPIKMLIAQEMSKEIDFKKSSPNLVAKLMGLDALPIQLPKSITQRSQPKSYLQQSRSLSHARRRAEYSHHGRSLSDDQVQHRFHEYQDCSDYKDVYNMLQQSQKGNSKKKKSLGKERNLDTEKKMSLVHEKLLEAKRLAPDEKLRQSKEFQDAMEVLSSNRDLFLKFLQEPNSLFSKHIHEYHSIPSPPETKCITILRPSKMVNNKFCALGKKSNYLTKKLSHVSPEGMGWDQSLSGYSSPYGCQDVGDYPTQPTQIVVLKPGQGESCDIKSVVPVPSSPGMLHNDNFSEKDEDDGGEEMREVAKEITHQMHENLMGHRRDETLLSSVFSNGYFGDDSSFNRSENEYLDGNLSDPEVVTPTSRHSWDFINRTDSPYSASSFSCASHSPESSVCKEAKKRLSERWTLIASNQNSLEQRHSRKSSSTLGEMLALSDRKKSVTLEQNGDGTGDQESVESISLLTDSVKKEESRVDPPKSLSRLKSVPVSSTVYGNQLNAQVLEPEIAKHEEHTKKAAEKSSRKWRVSSLFFSGSRKSSKDKASQSKNVSQSTASSSEYPYEKVNSSITNVATGILIENNEQPSPISVLDQQFEEDEKTTPEGSGKQVSSQKFTSNLIDKSPPIGSLARTLTWDDPHTQNTSPYSLKTPTACVSPSEEEEEDEKDWLIFIRNFLSAAGIEGKDPSDSSIPTCYLHENRLDLSLRDKFVALDEKHPLPEAKRRQRRSNSKLAFDFVSLVIVKMTGRGAYEGTISAERVWAQMKGWFGKEAGEEGSGGRDSLVVEKVVRNEVVGRWWVDNLRLEVDSLGLEIEGKLLQELVDEAIGDLSGTSLVAVN